MSLENFLSRMSGGKQLDLSAANYNKGSGLKKPNIDEYQGALAGLGRRETIYLFWAFMPNEGPLRMRVMLNAHLMKWLKSNNQVIEHNNRAAIVRLVMQGVKGSAFQPCKKCETTGKALIDNEYKVCPTCGGLGKKSISQREVARLLDIPWSTYYMKKIYGQAYSELMSFCAILEGTCFKHFSNKEE